MLPTGCISLQGCSSSSSHWLHARLLLFLLLLLAVLRLLLLFALLVHLLLFPL
jgi:hypothetical protein